MAIVVKVVLLTTHLPILNTIHLNKLWTIIPYVHSCQSILSTYLSQHYTLLINYVFSKYNLYQPFGFSFQQHAVKWPPVDSSLSHFSAEWPWTAWSVSLFLCALISKVPYIWSSLYSKRKSRHLKSRCFPGADLQIIHLVGWDWGHHHLMK